MEFVVGCLGWQKYWIVKSENIQVKISENDVPFSANLGVLVLTGITAYARLVDICKPKKVYFVVITTVAGISGLAVP